MEPKRADPLDIETRGSTVETTLPSSGRPNERSDTQDPRKEGVEIEQTLPPPGENLV